MSKHLFAIVAVSLGIILTACQATESIAHPPEEEPQEVQSAEELTVEEQLTQQLEALLAQIEGFATGPFQSQEQMDRAAEQVTELLVELGEPVRQLNAAMPNYQRVVEFLENREMESVTVHSVSAYDSISVWSHTFIRSEDKFSIIYTNLYQEEEGSGPWTVSVSDREALEKLELTPNGNLIYHARGNSDASGYRVVPLSHEQYQMYDCYVSLVDTMYPGVISQQWSAAEDYRHLNWEYVFERIWEAENGAFLVREDSPYYQTQDRGDYQEHYVALPADMVVETLQRYFDVPAEALRAMTSDIYGGTALYQPEEEAYHIYGFRGGGYKPTVEVWDITHNDDGSISLDLAWVSLDFEDDGYVYSTLTVMPLGDGGFRYLSNFFSEQTVKQLVESKLDLAKDLDLIQQGGFATVGDPVEIEGQQFAQIDHDAFYDAISLGGVASTASIHGWYSAIFTEEAAAKYLEQVFSIPLYADGEPDEEGEETLLVNLDQTGEPISQGSWVTGAMEIVILSADEITVRMEYDTGQGAQPRLLTMVSGPSRQWLLTDSYEGNLE